MDDSKAEKTPSQRATEFLTAFFEWWEPLGRWVKYHWQTMDALLEDEKLPGWFRFAVPNVFGRLLWIIVYALISFGPTMIAMVVFYAILVLRARGDGAKLNGDADGRFLVNLFCFVPFVVVFWLYRIGNWVKNLGGPSQNAKPPAPDDGADGEAAAGSETPSSS